MRTDSRNSFLAGENTHAACLANCGEQADEWLQGSLLDHGFRTTLPRMVPWASRGTAVPHEKREKYFTLSPLSAHNDISPNRGSVTLP